jgi:hypothetical protein
VSVIHKLTNSIWNKKDLPDQWKESIIVPIHKKGDTTDCNNYPGISLLSISYKTLPNILLSWFCTIRTISVDFDITDQLPIRFPAYVRYWGKKWPMRQYIIYS